MERSSSAKRRSSKRKRSSRSRSTTADHGLQEERIPEKQSYLSPARIVDIFGKDISPENLCALSALKYCSQAAVFRIMPSATVEQICQMVELCEEKPKPRTGIKAQQRKARAQKPKDRRMKARRKARSASAGSVLDRMTEVKIKSKAKPRSLICLVVILVHLRL